MFEMTTEKVFHANDKKVLRLLNVVIHEHQFKRKGIYYKFHFDKEAYTKPKNVKKNVIKKTITELIDDAGHHISDQSKILLQQHDFYKHCIQQQI